MGYAPNSSEPSSSPEPPELDLPPSYDALDSQGPSSSSRPSTFRPSSSTAAPPKDTLHLFSAPPHSEPLLGRMDTPLEVLNAIETKKEEGWIASIDPRLHDPTTLYDYIRHQSLQLPKIYVKCIGAHFETPERDEWVTDRDGQRHRRKGQPERIVDFEFTIDLTPVIAHTDNYLNAHLSTVPGDVAANRGTHAATYSAQFARAPNQIGEVTDTTPGRAATRAELARHKEWMEWARLRGLPPWARSRDWKDFVDRKGKAGDEGRVALLDDEEQEVGRDDSGEQADLRAWCETYCADEGLLKEFWVPCFGWGWNLDGLLTAIRSTIISTGYQSNHIDIAFLSDHRGLVIRPNNWLSRLLSQQLVYILLWITLIYPLIWLWRRYHPSGGAPYKVARTTHGMKFYPPLPSTYPGETLASAKDRLPGMYKIHRELPKPTVLAAGPKGIHYLLGRKEGEWFREWEERIRMAVRMRYRGELIGGAEEGVGAGLDGYEG